MNCTPQNVFPLLLKKTSPNMNALSINTIVVVVVTTMEISDINFDI